MFQTFDESNSLLVIVCRDGMAKCDVGDEVTIKRGKMGFINAVVVLKEQWRGFTLITVAANG